MLLVSKQQKHTNTWCLFLVGGLADMHFAFTFLLIDTMTSLWRSLNEKITSEAFESPL